MWPATAGLLTLQLNWLALQLQVLESIKPIPVEANLSKYNLLVTAIGFTLIIHYRYAESGEKSQTSGNSNAMMYEF